MSKKLASPPGRGDYTQSAQKLRVEFIRRHTGSSLAFVSNTSFKAERLAHNIEAFLGSVEIPVGIAGPLAINGQHASGIFYAPIATTEGALVASINRGAYAISLAGGVTTRVIRQRMMRVPLFICGTTRMAIALSAWMVANFGRIKLETQKHSNYAKLVELTPQVRGRAVHVHFVYETGDAAGQNMTTTCTWETCKWIMAAIDSNDIRIEKFMIEGGMSSDKKVSALNATAGRGINVQVEAILPANIIKRVLKTTPQDLIALWNEYSMVAHEIGLCSTNVNVANVIAAMFTATGQDIACVHESAIAHSKYELTDDGSLYMSMNLPSLVIGTVGGGTGLPHQKECLDILGCHGTGKVLKLAEIIAGYCMALDISTGSAIAAGQFAAIHERLGRNRELNCIRLGDLSTTFFQEHLRESLNDSQLVVDAVTLDDRFETHGSIATEMASRKIRKTVGLFPYQVDIRQAANRRERLDIMVKIKPTAEEIGGAAYLFAAMCDERLRTQFEKHKYAYGFLHCDKRELGMYALRSNVLSEYMPFIYGLYQDDEREAYVILQERLLDVELMDSASNVGAWESHHIRAALSGIAHCHSAYLGKTGQIAQIEWMSNQPNTDSRLELRQLYSALLDHGYEEFPELVSGREHERLQRLVNDIGCWWPAIDSRTKTLIHNDFNPRNIAMRRMGTGTKLCAFDWELAAIHIPSIDVAELLIFLFDGQDLHEFLETYLGWYRAELQKYSGLAQTMEDVVQGFWLAVMDFSISKLPFYLLTHSFKSIEYVPRIFRTTSLLLDALEKMSGFSYSDGATS